MTITQLEKIITKRKEARQEEAKEWHLKYHDHYAEIIQDFISLRESLSKDEKVVEIKKWYRNNVCPNCDYHYIFKLDNYCLNCWKKIKRVD